MINKDRIRTSVHEAWRQRLVEEEQAKQPQYDPVALGASVARTMDAHRDEIEADVQAAVEASEERQSWMGVTVRPLELVTSDPCGCCGSRAWVVDGAGGEFWLLCIGRDCVETKALPVNYTVST